MLFDAGGLFLLVTPNGGKWWRFKYRFEGKEKLLSLGIYPDVALGGHKDKQTEKWIDGARDKRDQARKLLASEIDPGAVRKTEKAEKLAANANTFEAVAREWHGLPKRKGTWSPETATARLKRLEQDEFSVIGSTPIAELRKPNLEKLLLDIAGRGTLEVARRVHTCSWTFSATRVGRAVLSSVIRQPTSRGSSQVPSRNTTPRSPSQRPWGH